MKRIARFLVSVKKEMTKVKWADKKTVITYSIATLTCILVFSLFFASLDLIITGIKLVIR